MRERLSVCNSVRAAGSEMRGYYVQAILGDLDHIQGVCHQPAADVFARRLLRNLRVFCDVLPGDPCLPVLMALHDALASGNAWASYGAAQFAAASRVLGALLEVERPDDRRVEKAIVELEDAGLDTLPFGARFDVAVTKWAVPFHALRDRHGTVIGDGVSVPEPETPRRKVVSLLCPKHAVRLAEEHHEAGSKPSTPESDERARRARWELAHEVWRECAACQALFAQAREKTAPSTEGSDAVSPGGV